MKMDAVFNQWHDEVEALLDKWYGINTGDCILIGQLIMHFSNRETPEEVVKWIGNKHALVRIDGWRKKQ